MPSIRSSRRSRKFSSAPIVAVNLWYHVGSANERDGRTGFAHLFEHIMFMGSQHVPTGDFDRLLEAELGRLSPKERTCVEWHYLDGRTHREIGLILGLPLNTVTSIIHRTRQKLGEALGGKGLGTRARNPSFCLIFLPISTFII